MIKFYVFNTGCENFELVCEAKDLIKVAEILESSKLVYRFKVQSQDYLSQSDCGFGGYQKWITEE